MLNQILEEMKVEPDLLKLLTEEQKQVLFAKMREEQVRRWKVREQKEAVRERIRPQKRTPPKTVGFLHGADGNPWVWVMGDHSSDLSYEELVKKREQEELRKEKLNDMQDRKEAEEIAKLDVLDLSASFSALGAKKTTALPQAGKTLGKIPEDSAGMFDTTDGGFDTTDGGFDTTYGTGFLENSIRSYVRTESTTSLEELVEVEESPLMERKDARKTKSLTDLRRKTLDRKSSIIGTSEEQKTKFKQHRSEELYSSLKRVKEIVKKRAEQVAKRTEQGWLESEKKAKTYEMKRRLSIQRAKEIAIKSPDAVEKVLKEASEKQQAQKTKPVRKAPPPPLLKKSSVVSIGTQPKSGDHVIRWFREDEIPRGVALEKDGSISLWFHGMITRDLAEKLLEHKPVGTYLVRFCLKIWGYTVSVRGYTDYKHFLVDAANGKYQFMGRKQRSFTSLNELLSFYRANPITWAGQEHLLLPCEPEEESESLNELFHEEPQDYEVSYI